MATDALSHGQVIEKLMTDGLTRPEAFTILRDRENASAGVTSIAYPIPEVSQIPMNDDDERTAFKNQFVMLERVIGGLRDELKPYLSDEDVERVVVKAKYGAEGK